MSNDSRMSLTLILSFETTTLFTLEQSIFQRLFRIKIYFEFKDYFELKFRSK